MTKCENPAPVEVDDDTQSSEAPTGSISVAPGASFQKTWVIENTGNTTWSTAGGYSLAHVNGDSLGGAFPAALGASESVAPKAQKTWAVAFVAPTTPGTYAVISAWTAPARARSARPCTSTSWSPSPRAAAAAAPAAPATPAAPERARPVRPAAAARPRWAEAAIASSGGGRRDVVQRRGTTNVEANLKCAEYKSNSSADL